MRLPLLPVLIVLAAGILAVAYIYWYGRKCGWFNGLWRALGLWVIPGLASAAMLAVACSPVKNVSDSELSGFMWVIFSYFSIFIPIFIFVIFCALRQLIGAFAKTKKLRVITWLGAGIAGLLFVMMWYGALFTRYQLDVREVDVPVKGLPSEFEGYRIVQISDIHTGSYGGNPRFLTKLVEKINSLKPDVVLFTGDIVNRHSAELQPFMEALSELRAPYGVWSVMGNHDYGEYSSWPSEADRLADVAHLKEMQSRMGWQMLNNEHTMLRRGNDSIALIGVENIGDPPFTTYGDLRRAYPTLNDSVTKILMSHNPAHWVDSIAGKPEANIALTLAGHTHAMQIRLFGRSPAALRYHTWGGLYPDSLGRYLYVNIGIGEVGFPSRIGATPEITVITLQKQ